MTIEELCHRAHKNAVDHGFYAKEMEMKAWLRVAATSEQAEQDNLRALDHALFAQRIALIQSELSEALEADRNDRRADIREYERKIEEVFTNTSTELPDKINLAAIHFRALMKDTLEDELADACIRIFDLAGHLGINLQDHIAHKMEYNRYRPALHGKKY